MKILKLALAAALLAALALPAEAKGTKSYFSSPKTTFTSSSKSSFFSSAKSSFFSKPSTPSLKVPSLSTKPSSSYSGSSSGTKSYFSSSSSLGGSAPSTAAASGSGKSGFWGSLFGSSSKSAAPSLTVPKLATAPAAAPAAAAPASGGYVPKALFPATAPSSNSINLQGGSKVVVNGSGNTITIGDGTRTSIPAQRRPYYTGNTADAYSGYRGYSGNSGFPNVIVLPGSSYGYQDYRRRDGYYYQNGYGYQNAGNPVQQQASVPQSAIYAALPQVTAYEAYIGLHPEFACHGRDMRTDCR